MYKPAAPILDRGRWRGPSPAAIVAGTMADVQRQAGRPPGRPRPGDPFMQEVRWRLFRRQDIPARLRRLERLEDVALSDRTAEAPPAAGAEEQAPG